MVCPKCGSPVSGDDQTCSNCGEGLERELEGLEGKTEGLREMSRQIKAVDPDAQRFAAGETVAERFEIEELVDEGPFGEVYRARDSVIETDVALKILDDGLVDSPPERETFLAATRSARAMTQKNVVRIHDSGVHEGHPWISMQYLEGLTLKKTLELRENKGERFGLEELEPVVTQVTLALQHIGREFPNGDLKPTNIFFLPDLLKLTDGYMLAAIPGEKFTDRLEDSKYLAPELHTSAEAADVRCDVYSLGMIIGEMHFGPDYTPGSDEVSARGDSAVDALCRRATAFDPAERYPTVEALSEDFSTLVDTGQLLDQGPSAPAPPAEPPPGPSGEPETTRREERPGFGEFPEDAIATEDYERTTGTGGEDEQLPPTNEVDRSEYPAPPKPGSHEDAGPDAGESGEPAGAEEPTTEHEPASEARASGRPSEKRGGDEEGSSAGLAIGAGLIVLAVAGLGWFAMSSPEEGEEVVDISDESKQATAAEDETEDETEEESEEERDDGPSDEALAAAVDEGAGGVDEAVSAAGDEAESQAEALAEKRNEEEQQREQEQAGGGGDRAGGGSQGGRASAESESAGTASGRSGGGQEEASEQNEGTDCPDGMALVQWDRGNFCIDRFEYPGRNQTPMNNATWFEAKSECQSNGKRLCELDEWRRSCGVKYPYGREWDPSKCNTQDEAGFPRTLAPSGEFQECRSWTGAYDMVGNVLEWVKEQKIVGGGFGGGPDVANCRYSSSKSPGTASRTVGFRCCADPE